MALADELCTLLLAPTAVEELDVTGMDVTGMDVTGVDVTVVDVTVVDISCANGGSVGGAGRDSNAKGSGGGGKDGGGSVTVGIAPAVPEPLEPGRAIVIDALPPPPLAPLAMGLGGEDGGGPLGGDDGGPLGGDGGAGGQGIAANGPKPQKRHD